MADVAQLVEPSVVVRVVMGSSPIVRPIQFLRPHLQRSGVLEIVGDDGTRKESRAKPEPY